MTEQLKPCPFCGGTDIEIHRMPAVMDAPDTAQCAGCNACAEVSRWNTRTWAGTVPVRSELLEELYQHARGLSPDQWDELRALLVQSEK